MFVCHSKECQDRFGGSPGFASCWDFCPSCFAQPHAFGDRIVSAVGSLTPAERFVLLAIIDFECKVYLYFENLHETEFKNLPNWQGRMSEFLKSESWRFKGVLPEGLLELIRAACLEKPITTSSEVSEQSKRLQKLVDALLVYINSHRVTQY